MNLKQMIDRSEEYDTHKADQVERVDAVRFVPSGIALPDSLFGGAVEYGFTDWALGQVCNKLGPPPTHYIKQCPGWLRAANFEHWRKDLIEQDAEKKWLVRSYDNDCRALLSNEYSTLANTSMLKWADEYTSTLNGGPTHVRPYLDADTMHLKMIFRTQDFGNGKGEWGFGIYLGNGEIGNRRVRALPLIQRHSCDNSIIITEGGTTIVHRFKSEHFIEASVKQGILEGLRMSVEQIDAVWKAAVDEIEDLDKVLAKLCKQKGWDDDTKNRILMGTEGESTVLGAINGISYAAHQQDDPELAVDMETFAGSILVDRNSLFGQATRKIREEITVR